MPANALGVLLQPAQPFVDSVDVLEQGGISHVRHQLRLLVFRTGVASAEHTPPHWHDARLMRDAERIPGLPPSAMRAPARCVSGRCENGSGTLPSRRTWTGDGFWYERLLPNGSAVVSVAAASNIDQADRLERPLLVLHGELDDNVHPSNTLTLVDALIRADRDFEFVLIPGANHACHTHPYYVRRVWDFFVRELLGRTPPPGRRSPY